MLCWGASRAFSVTTWLFFNWMLEFTEFSDSFLAWFWLSAAGFERRLRDAWSLVMRFLRLMVSTWLYWGGLIRVSWSYWWPRWLLWSIFLTLLSLRLLPFSLRLLPKPFCCKLDTLFSLSKWFWAYEHTVGPPACVWSVLDWLSVYLPCLLGGLAGPLCTSPTELIELTERAAFSLNLRLLFLKTSAFWFAGWF